MIAQTAASVRPSFSVRNIARLVRPKIRSTAGALRHGSIQPEPAAARMAPAHRIAAPLLAVTLVCMVIARYV